MLNSSIDFIFLFPLFNFGSARAAMLHRTFRASGDCSRFEEESWTTNNDVVKVIMNDDG